MLAYVVVANPKEQGDELPAVIGIGIPTANLDDWAFLASLESILTFDVVVNETPRTTDRARPKLKVVQKKDESTE